MQDNMGASADAEFARLHGCLSRGTDTFGQMLLTGKIKALQRDCAALAQDTTPVDAKKKG